MLFKFKNNLIVILISLIFTIKNRLFFKPHEKKRDIVPNIYKKNKRLAFSGMGHVTLHAHFLGINIQSIQCQG